MTTPEQLAKWREEAATAYMTDDISFITSNEKRNYIAGYLRAKQETEQALTPITADDVTDEMVKDCMPQWMMTELEDVCEIFVQIYNAVIKIGVKHERKNSNSD